MGSCQGDKSKGSAVALSPKSSLLWPKTDSQRFPGMPGAEPADSQACQELNLAIRKGLQACQVLNVPIRKGFQACQELNVPICKGPRRAGVTSSNSQRSPAVMDQASHTGERLSRAESCESDNSVDSGLIDAIPHRPPTPTRDGGF